MIIQCEKCQTKFRLDDSRVTEKGVKVRCTKCKQVFTVRKEDTPPEQFAPAAAFPGSANPSSRGGEVDFSGFDPGDNSYFAEPDSTASADNFNEMSISPKPDAAQPGEARISDFSDVDSIESSSFDDSSVSFEPDHPFGTGQRPAEAEEPAAAGEVDFSGFDLGDSSSFAGPDSTVSADNFSEISIASAPDAAQPGESPLPDFSDEDALDQSSFDGSAVSFETDEQQPFETGESLSVTEEPSAAEGEVDFSSFDFGDSEPEPASTLNPTQDGTIESPPPAPQGLDFSDDAMFGEVVQAVPEVSSNTISFDFGEEDISESTDMNSQNAASRNSSIFSLDTPSPSDAPFNLGEIDFGDELTSVAVQQVNPEDLKPSQEILFAPLAEAREKSADRSISGGVAADEQGMPPLSIASRRKQSPLFSGLIALVAFMVISVIGYLWYSSFSNPKETAAPEVGRISVQAIKAAYIENDEAGELLVISGEALNEYSKPRAALQVKVTVFDSAGQSLATKTAYGGNPLTEEQLESLPLDKIETAMANQFGDSLANMEVAPGKAIPFVVVLANIPKGAKDFEVSSAGSTVATGKQE